MSPIRIQDLTQHDLGTGCSPWPPAIETFGQRMSKIVPTSTCITSKARVTSSALTQSRPQEKMGTDVRTTKQHEPTNPADRNEGRHAPRGVWAAKGNPRLRGNEAGVSIMEAVDPGNNHVDRADAGITVQSWGITRARGVALTRVKCASSGPETVNARMVLVRTTDYMSANIAVVRGTGHTSTQSRE